MMMRRMSRSGHCWNREMRGFSSHCGSTMNRIIGSSEQGPGACNVQRRQSPVSQERLAAGDYCYGGGEGEGGED